MIYKLILKAKDFSSEIDDTVEYDQQPKMFRTLFAEQQENNEAEFDNAKVVLFDSGRVIITQKEINNEVEK